MYHGERLNSITHLVGTCAAALGCAGLVYAAVLQGDIWKIVSFTLYGSTLFILYLASTLYHSSRGSAKGLLQKFDHISIYLLIAGSYTPFTLVTLEGAWGWPMFIAIWALALVGIVFDVLSKGGERRLQIIIYLVMGWLMLVAIYPMSQALPFAGMAWLFAGGFFYTSGLFFYLKDDVITHGHGIWHLFVIAGSVSHYIVVAAYVA